MNRSRIATAAVALLLSTFVPLAGCDSGSADRGTPAGDDLPPSVKPGDPDLSWIVPADPPVLPEDLETMARLIRDGRTGPARVRVRKHLNLHPDDVRALFLFGLSYHREKKYDQAREWYVKAIAADATYSPVYHFDGWAAYYLGDMDAARRSFLTHLAWQPREADSHFGLGVIAIEEGRLDDAEHHLHDSIELLVGHPNVAKGVSKARARLGDIAMQRDDLEAARVEYEKSVELYPDHYEVFNKLARVCDRLELPEKADEARASFEAARGRVRPDLGATPAPVRQPE